MNLAPLPKRYDTKISPIAVPSKPVEPQKSSNLLPILVIAGIGLFLMKS